MNMTVEIPTETVETQLARLMDELNDEATENAGGEAWERNLSIRLTEQASGVKDVLDLVRGGFDLEEVITDIEGMTVVRRASEIRYGRGLGLDIVRAEIACQEG